MGGASPGNAPRVLRKVSVVDDAAQPGQKPFKTILVIGETGSTAPTVFRVLCPLSELSDKLSIGQEMARQRSSTQ